MNNSIKNYFQQVYNETGKKPFTFLNAFILTILPLGLGYLLTMMLVSAKGEQESFILVGFGLAYLICYVINFLLLGKNFKDNQIKLLIYSIIASIVFFVSFFLWPLLKFAFRAGAAATQANLGNTTASVNASGRAGATKGKKSALNWFEYDGHVWQDEKENMPEDIPNSALDEGSYSYEQNQKAKAYGYSNGKDAEISGRSWNGNDWV